jgi:hypothetical protein
VLQSVAHTVRLERGNGFRQGALLKLPLRVFQVRCPLAHPCYVPGFERLPVLGLDSRDYSGHSLRAGLATATAIAGASEQAPDRAQVKRNGAAVHQGQQSVRENAAARVGR